MHAVVRSVVRSLLGVHGRAQCSAQPEAWRAMARATVVRSTDDDTGGDLQVKCLRGRRSWLHDAFAGRMCATYADTLDTIRIMTARTKDDH